MKNGKIIKVKTLTIPVIGETGDTPAYEKYEDGVKFTLKKAMTDDEILSLVLKYMDKEHPEESYMTAFMWSVAAVEYLMQELL